jgi:hypothetical protein
MIKRMIKRLRRCLAIEAPRRQEAFVVQNASTAGSPVGRRLATSGRQQLPDRGLWVGLAQHR